VYPYFCKNKRMRKKVEKKNSSAVRYKNHYEGEHK